MNPAGCSDLEPDWDNAGGPRPRRLTAPLALALAYAALGMAWILLSDRLLQSITADPRTLAALSRGKGMAFVLVTSGLVYLVAVRRGPGMGEPARQDRSAGLMWVFALLCAAVVIASLVSYSGAAQKAYEQQVGQLRREAQLRAGIVGRWTERSLQEARQLGADPTLRAGLQRWRHHPDAEATNQLRRQLQMLPAAGRYTDALLLDPQARLLLGQDDDAADLAPALAEDALAALRRGEVGHSDFQARADDPASLHFNLFVPLPGPDGRPDAVLVLRAAPRRTLLPQLLAGSAAGNPETLLLRPTAQGLLALGLGASDMPVARPNGAPTPASLASLAANPGLAGQVLAGLASDREATAAVAMALPESGWYVAVQLPRSTLHGEGAAAGAATLSLVNVLAVLVTGAVVYAALRRRELQAASRRAADRREMERAWKIAEVIANSSTDAIFARDLQGRYLLANGAMCRLLGRGPEQLLGSDARDLFPPEQVRRFLADDDAVLRSAAPISFETRCSTEQGERVDACTRGRLLDGDGRVIGVYGVSSDVTARRALQQRMRQWSTAFEDMRDGVIVTDAQGRIQSVNRAFTEITGYAAEEAIGTGMKLLQSGRHDKAFYERMWTLINQTGSWQGEIWNRRKNGDIFPEWLTVRAMRDEDGPVTHYVGVFTDVSRIKDSEALADWLLHHDPLTRLPNRVQLQRQLEQVLACARRRETQPALMVIALDGFKTVNDSLGHPAGDELLVCVAERLRAGLHHKDLLGRLGGDEFLLILDNGADADEVGVLAQQLLAAVSEPVALSCGQDAYLTASIGICPYPEAGSPSGVELLRNADAAMHRAKELGRNRLCFYAGDMHATAMAKLEVEAALSRAIERDELRLHYQPKVASRSGRVVGAEALLRWQRGGIGMVPPGQFIPLAEQSSLILDIGAWVIDAACRQIRAWMDAGQPVVRIAVNVAARQFAAGDLDAVVADALRRHAVAAHHLELELTEGMLMSNPQAGTAALHRLRDLGVKIALDDFGTGYSSLAYLQQFPIDTLKIDQSFVRRIGDEPDGAALVDAIIGLAHRLHLRVVAEGVETATQHQHLLRQRCDEMQGYHFGRPAPAEALQALLVAQPASAAA
ncbi:bifunctional diguanylate cyclase/phosphodiesterase [Roseateles sp.]|uniref:putative bifunctional diguanylate cyclase/phosphodiesterase n=1 Tax=Roseateles sp. TaxID=1971397 RepID=UPI0025F5F724|nr:bifunctional diguanylate cyclase/phosphodiesterase [Roseateles sp.]MBV8033463.1 EAL domain-containing protein [Roseateles sp.]